MINVTVNILENLRPKILQWNTAMQGKDQEKQLEKMEMVFIGKFWFSNLAWLNEIKRFFKTELRKVNDQ